MNFFFDLVIGGLSIGACYALVALAMVIIYKTPLGMHGIYLRCKRYWRMWPF